MRAKGFRVFPVSARSLPKVAGVAFWGYLGYTVGLSFVYEALGDDNQYKHLSANKRAIMSGEIGMN
jgi:hypothetical protein